MSRLAIVTATIAYDRARPCIESWLATAQGPLDLYIVGNGSRNEDWVRVRREPGVNVYGMHRREILGVVPAFAAGVQRALVDGAEIIACLHDDVEIEGDNWDQEVLHLFRACPHAGLVGFGGAFGLADDDIYKRPYNPMQLVRKRFVSNMRHAEAHGERCTVPHRISVLDGFSQIGTRAFWTGQPHVPGKTTAYKDANLLDVLQKLGVVHHAYDAALGAFAAQLGYQVWLCPIPVHHHGGLTAVGDPRYHSWANTTYQYEDLEQPEKGVLTGDQAFWEKSHRVVYELFRDVLPLRVHT